MELEREFYTLQQRVAVNETKIETIFKAVKETNAKLDSLIKIGVVALIGLAVDLILRFATIGAG